MSQGKKFRRLVAKEPPLQIAGAVNAYCALLAQRAGFKALYLSGAGVANASLGLPDLGVTTLGDVLEDTRRLTAATELPLLVDVIPASAAPSTSRAPFAKWSAPALLPSISRIRRKQSAAAIGRTRQRCPWGRCAIDSKRPWTRAATASS